MRYLILFAASASLAAAASAAEHLPQKIKPVMVWTGTNSNPAKEAFDRCSSQKEWKVIWHKHQGRDEQVDVSSCPEVDFDSYMVIAIFQGESLTNLGVQVFAVLEDDHCIRVQYRPPTWQTGFSIDDASNGGADRREKRKANNEHKYDPQSYAFIIVPKSRKAIAFDEDVRELITRRSGRNRLGCQRWIQSRRAGGVRLRRRTRIR